MCISILEQSRIGHNCISKVDYVHFIHLNKDFVNTILFRKRLL